MAPSNAPIVYLIRDADHTPVYVGQTRAWQNRWSAHRHASSWFSRARHAELFVLRRDVSLLEAEALAIGHYCPTENSQISKPPRQPRWEHWADVLSADVLEWQWRDLRQSQRTHASIRPGYGDVSWCRDGTRYWS